MRRERSMSKGWARMGTNRRMERIGRLRLGRRRADWAFVLFEVMVAMTILGVTMSSVMGGFMTGLRTLKTNRISILGMILAQRLLEEYEIEMPPVGEDFGHFGEAFSNFEWEREVFDEPVHYNNPMAADNIYPLADMLYIRLRILYVEEPRPPVIAFEIQTASTQMERFSKESRLRNGLYPILEGRR